MIQAIIYTSNAGTTAQYAKMLGERTGLPVYALEQTSALARGTQIIYLGWLMAGIVKGYKKAAKRYTVCALCGVGMGETGSQIEDIKKANPVPDGLPVFTLRGGFDITRLHGIYKFMMNTMRKTEGKKLQQKPNRTSDEETMLEMLMDGKNCVSEENTDAILRWYQKESER